MRKDYSQLSQNILARLNPEGVLLEKAFSDTLSGLSYNDVRRFVQFAMKGVEPEYTKRSRDSGERVKQHLENGLSDVEYRYQGSVMTNTHIKGYSDIDLLVICKKFYGWDASGTSEYLDNYEKRSQLKEEYVKKLEWERNISPYKGESLQDLRSIRLNSEIILRNAYLDCDISKPKAIKITNRSLNRDVDIVTANWYDDVRSIVWDKGENRGIQVYNKDDHAKGSPTYPFRSIKRINERSSETNGRLKKMIRFLKNCKSLSTSEIKLSSFDINAICYDVDVEQYASRSIYELVKIMYEQLERISSSSSEADKVLSVDQSEYVFYGDYEKKRALVKLAEEVGMVYLDLLENHRVLLAG